MRILIDKKQLKYGKNLNLHLSDRLFSLAPTKLERKKIYGWTELRATDADSNICRQVGLDGNGVTIIPKGATKIGMLCEDGNWMEKDELQAVHPDGRVAESVPSSFDGEIALDHKVTVEDLLDNVISSVCQLGGDEAGELAQALGNDIYSFFPSAIAEATRPPMVLCSATAQCRSYLSAQKHSSTSSGLKNRRCSTNRKTKWKSKKMNWTSQCSDPINISAK